MKGSWGVLGLVEGLGYILGGSWVVKSGMIGPSMLVITELP